MASLAAFECDTLFGKYTSAFTIHDGTQKLSSLSHETKYCKFDKSNLSHIYDGYAMLKKIVINR